jgi:ribonuclease BN (tRNA processing enzyme)
VAPGAPVPGAGEAARPRLLAPGGAGQTFRGIVGSWGAEELIEDAFALREYVPGEELEVGPLRVRFHPVPHFVPTCAIDVRSTAAGSGRFTFGADTAPSEELVGFADGTDLLMIEATLQRPECGGERGHLTPAEAGEHGRRAHARRLVITHFSDELDEHWVRREAERTFGAPVSLAREGAVYDV